VPYIRYLQTVTQISELNWHVEDDCFNLGTDMIDGRSWMAIIYVNSVLLLEVVDL
jgi:hypothetical protein